MGDALHAGVDTFGPPHIVGVIKRAQRGGPDFLQRRKRRPASEQIEGERGAEILAAELERLREVALQQALQAIDQLGSQIDGRAPGATKQIQPPRGIVVTVQWLQPITVALDERQKHVGIWLIVLGSGWCKRFR